MADKKIHKIAPGLETLMTPIAELHRLPSNPRLGDVHAVAKSYKEFGQRKPVVYQTRRGKKVVVAGNHQLEAVAGLGWTHIAAVSADDLTMKQAQAFALADNRIGELGLYDESLLVELLSSLPAELVDVTGYSDIDIERLLGTGYDSGSAPEGFDEFDVDSLDLEHQCPKCGFEFD